MADMKGSRSRRTEEEEEDTLSFDQLSISDNAKDTDNTSIQVATGETPYTSAKRFEDLNLSDDILKGLYVEMRFERPSKVQAVTLPMILTPPYKNLIAQAHNGSGKTTCFVLGMLSRVDPKLQEPQALCFCPTRELAIQTEEVLSKMGKYTGITSELAIPNPFTGVSIINRDSISSQIVIGTPGTIKKWISMGKLSVASINILVFDEADHMFDQAGFQDDSLRIIKSIKREGSSANCQVLLFSATFSDKVKSFVTKTIQNYNQLFVKKEDLSLESVKQYKVRCFDESMKVKVVGEKILELGRKLGKTIIFVRTRDSAGSLCRALVELGYGVTDIQGALTHDERDKIVEEFNDGVTKVLISTDLLARGFDQPEVNLVVNYDLPVDHTKRTEPNYETYLHRVGRAGRFGRKGAAFNFVCDDIDDVIMSKIENHFGTKVPEVPSLRDEDFEVALKEAGLL